MEERIDYVPLLPTAPPEDLVAWTLRQGALKEEYLVYRSGRRYLPLEDRTEDCVEVTCSACGNKFTAEKVKSGGCRNAYEPAPFGWWNNLIGEAVISGSSTTCPFCGDGMTTKHIGCMGHFGESNRAWAAVFYRLPVEGEKDRLCVVDWMVEKTIDKDAKTSFRTHLWSAWVIEEKKIVRIMGYRKCMSSCSLQRPEQRRSFCDDFQTTNLIYPWDPALLIGTTAENSKLDGYIAGGGRRLIAYLGLYVKRPQVENLVVQGLAPLVAELLDSERERNVYQASGGYPKLAEWINWKEKRPAKMLGMTKEQLKIFRDMHWGVRSLVLVAWSNAVNLPVSWPSDVERLRARGAYECKRIFEEQGKKRFWKVMRYIEKNNSDYRHLCDYWEMAERLQMDLDDEQVKFPKDLRAAHDKAIERYNRQKEELSAAAFIKRAKELARFSWEDAGLLIRPCATSQELREEGKELHHCVATYAERHARGDTAIFFIRRTDEPDKPFYTLELDEKNIVVRQNRGLRNCGKTEEIQAFEDAWISWAKNQITKKKRKGKAA